MCANKTIIIIRLQCMKPFTCIQTNEFGRIFKLLPTNHSFTNQVYLLHMFKDDLTLNNQQGLICRKIQPTNQLLMPRQLARCLHFV